MNLFCCRMDIAIACEGLSNVAHPVRPHRVRTLRHPHDMQRHFQPFLRQHLKNIQKVRKSLQPTEREFEAPPDVPLDTEEQCSPFRYISDSKPSVWTLSQLTELLPQKPPPEVIPGHLGSAMPTCCWHEVSTPSAYEFSVSPTESIPHHCFPCGTACHWIANIDAAIDGEVLA